MLANVGIPMIFVQWPLMLCALVPIIVIEALLIRRSMQLSYSEAFTGIAKANVASTLIGVPLAWLAMFGLELAVMLPVEAAANRWHWKLDTPVLDALGFVISIAWLSPVERSLYWMIPLAAALLLIPCFYVSVWIENRLCIREWANSDPVVVRRSVYRANLASYALLFVLACAWLGIETFARAR